MRSYVVDTSVSASWCFDDENDPHSMALLARLCDPRAGDSAVVPCFWLAEMANTLVVAEKRGRLKPGKAQEALEMMGYLPVEFESPGLGAARRALDISLSHGLSAYDAMYIEICARRGLPLASKDADMRRVASALGIPLI